MNIRDLKYLLALSEHKHFGKAAESCFISQPALSMQIKKLENYLGVTLLERTNKSVMLSEVGLAIAERAQQILDGVEDIHELAKLHKDIYSGELKIGIIPTLAPYLLPLIIANITKKFPKLTLYLIEEQTENLLAKIKSGKLDAAFLALPLSETNLSSMHLFDEEFLLAVPRSHPLSGR